MAGVGAADLRRRELQSGRRAGRRRRRGVSALRPVRRSGRAGEFAHRAGSCAARDRCNGIRRCSHARRHQPAPVDQLVQRRPAPAPGNRAHGDRQPAGAAVRRTEFRPGYRVGPATARGDPRPVRHDGQAGADRGASFRGIAAARRPCRGDRSADAPPDRAAAGSRSGRSTARGSRGDAGAGSIRTACGRSALAAIAASLAGLVVRPLCRGLFLVAVRRSHHAVVHGSGCGNHRLRDGVVRLQLPLVRRHPEIRAARRDTGRPRHGAIARRHSADRQFTVCCA